MVTEHQLAQKFHNDPAEFLSAVCCSETDAGKGHTTGHVGTLSFDCEEELNDYLAELGEEIEGFYGCRSESRPYNF